MPTKPKTIILKGKSGKNPTSSVRSSRRFRRRRNWTRIPSLYETIEGFLEFIDDERSLVKAREKLRKLAEDDTYWKLLDQARVEARCRANTAKQLEDYLEKI